MLHGEYKRIHNKFIEPYRHKDKYWDWFVNRVLDRKKTNRYGWFINTIGKYLKDGMSVLDIGGGVGMFGAYLINVEGYKFNYTVLDLPHKKSVAEKYFQTFNVACKFVVGSMLDSLPFPPEEFHMIWCFGVPFWGVKKVHKKNAGIINPDTPKVHNEIYRVLKPNGIYMFTIRYYKPHTDCYNYEEVVTLMNQSNFKTITIQKDTSGWVKEHFVLVKK